MGTHFKVKSLSGKIFSNVLVFTIVVIVALSVVLTSIYYFSYENEAEEDLASAARTAATHLNSVPSQQDEKLVSQQFSGELRYTLIAQDGTVSYDSAANAASMENHADRPEVRQARESGEAVTMRYSDTLESDTLYAAVQLDDGSVLRLAETRHSLMSFLGEMCVPVLIAILVAVALVFVLARSLTRRIMKPIDALDFGNLLDNEIYEEMDPLLLRIDDQQKQLMKQNQELAEAESMRRDFSSNVSHEMKTPLQVISGYAELMKNDMVLPADRQKFAGLIHDEAQAMRSLINDVLTLSKLDESAFGHEDQAPIDLHGVAERMAGRLSSFAEKAGVSVHITGGSGSICGSETLVEEMTYNLIENGIRYNHEGGEVTLNVSVGMAANADEPQNDHGMCVTMRVSDTGPGVPKEYLDKIFERFFRVDKSRSKETGGTGLGLAIVKHAVLYHNGTIAVESEEGKGTTFTMKFPAA